ncbi:MAG: hypothetical protein E7459_04465 [Ruminococcaceae bacterium]|nr:hypothetical protein [Oscillospiraceae bacterium]
MRQFRGLTLLLAGLLFLLSACTPRHPESPATTSPTQETLPLTAPTAASATQPTIAQETEPEETLPDVQLVMDDGFIPILIGEYPCVVVGADGPSEAPKTITVYYTAWDMENGGFTETTPWYHQNITSWVLTNIPFWAGGSYVVTWPTATKYEQGLTIREAAYYDTYYDNVNRVDGEDGSVALTRFTPNGFTHELPLCAIPEGFYTDETKELGTRPYYIWSDGESLLTLYVATDNLNTDLVYGLCALNAPDEVQWNMVSLPMMYASDIFHNLSRAYHDGKLYFGSLKGILEVDLESGEVLVLDETNLFRDVFQIYPNSRWNYDLAECQMYVVGCWNDTLIFETTRWTDEEEGEKYHVFYVAVKDGQIQGVMERSEWGLFTFYDRNLQVLGTDDRYQLTLEPYCVKFPLEG